MAGASVLIYVIDRLLADNGEVAATMLTRLSPLLGPVWASYPIVLLVAVIALVGRDKWTAAQRVRAIEVAATREAAERLAAMVGEVASGLTGLRGEVADLRTDLREHADTTDARFRSADASLRDFVHGEISPLRTRVDALEQRPRPRARAAPRAASVTSHKNQ